MITINLHRKYAKIMLRRVLSNKVTNEHVMIN